MAKLEASLRGMGAACLLAAATLVAQPAIAKERWRAYTYNAVSTVTAAKGLKAMLDAIQKETDGELSIRLNLGGTIPISATNRSEEHTSELQSLMRISYAVFCLKKKK